MQKDLVLDLSAWGSIDLDTTNKQVVKYTGSYVRKIILNEIDYINNNSWGNVSGLKSKGIQVVSA